MNDPIPLLCPNPNCQTPLGPIVSADRKTLIFGAADIDHKTTLRCRFCTMLYVWWPPIRTPRARAQKVLLDMKKPRVLELEHNITMSPG
jgi:hypothetical protein